MSTAHHIETHPHLMRKLLEILAAINQINREARRVSRKG